MVVKVVVVVDVFVTLLGKNGFYFSLELLKRNNLFYNFKLIRFFNQKNKNIKVTFFRILSPI